MFCSRCGTELKDEMAFCTNCGAPQNGADSVQLGTPTVADSEKNVGITEGDSEKTVGITEGDSEKTVGITGGDSERTIGIADINVEQIRHSAAEDGNRYGQEFSREAENV